MIVLLLDVLDGLNVKEWLCNSVCFYIFLLIPCLFHIFSLPLRPVKIKLTRNNDESHKEY